MNRKIYLWNLKSVLNQKLIVISQLISIFSFLSLFITQCFLAKNDYYQFIFYKNIFLSINLLIISVSTIILIYTLLNNQRSKELMLIELRLGYNVKTTFWLRIFVFLTIIISYFIIIFTIGMMFSLMLIKYYEALISAIIFQYFFYLFFMLFLCPIMLILGKFFKEIFSITIIMLSVFLLVLYYGLISAFPVITNNFKAMTFDRFNLRTQMGYEFYKTFKNNSELKELFTDNPFEKYNNSTDQDAKFLDFSFSYEFLFNNYHQDLASESKYFWYYSDFNFKSVEKAIDFGQYFRYVVINDKIEKIFSNSIIGDVFDSFYCAYSSEEYKNFINKNKYDLSKNNTNWNIFNILWIYGSHSTKIFDISATIDFLNKHECTKKYKDLLAFIEDWYNKLKWFLMPNNFGGLFLTKGSYDFEQYRNDRMNDIFYQNIIDNSDDFNRSYIFNWNKENEYENILQQTNPLVTDELIKEANQMNFEQNELYLENIDISIINFILMLAYRSSMNFEINSISSYFSNQLEYGPDFNSKNFYDYYEKKYNKWNLIAGINILDNFAYLFNGTSKDYFMDAGLNYSGPSPAKGLSYINRSSMEQLEENTKKNNNRKSPFIDSNYNIHHGTFYFWAAYICYYILIIIGYLLSAKFHIKNIRN